jgi:hypothetical protein
MVPQVVAWSPRCRSWARLALSERWRCRYRLHRRVSLARVLARVGDSSYSLGPALVLVLAGKQDFLWSAWPLLLLVFGAQLVGDSAAGLARTWFAERIGPASQIQMVWLT